MIELLALIWILLCIVVGGVAHAKNRNAIGWFILAMIISPLFALLALIAVPVRPASRHPDPLRPLSPTWIILFLFCGVIGVMLALQSPPTGKINTISSSIRGPR
jgi:hypothetical protein